MGASATATVSRITLSRRGKTDDRTTGPAVAFTLDLDGESPSYERGSRLSRGCSPFVTLVFRERCTAVTASSTKNPAPRLTPPPHVARLERVTGAAKATCDPTAGTLVIQSASSENVPAVPFHFPRHRLEKTIETESFH